MTLKNTHDSCMQQAIAIAKSGLEKGQTPFGACIMRGEDVLALAHNEVWQRNDSTAHAEIVAIRQACTQTNGIDLSGCTIYSTCEPCPMCFSAIHWAGINHIVYGATIADAAAAGFRELSISNQQMKDIGKLSVQITTTVLQQDCKDLFTHWAAQPEAKRY